MRIRSVVLAIGSGAALYAAPVLAQGRPLPAQKPPARSQQASAGPATPAPQVVQTQSNYPYDRYGRTSTRVALYPAQVAVDGRVYANFGSGLTVVGSQCAQRQVNVVQPATGATQPAAPVQPVPQMSTTTVPGVSQGASATYNGGVNACWTRAANGTVQVYRYW